MSAQPDISVIIPTYNLEEYIGATLESALLQQGVSLEILVVDDNSSDSTVNIVQKYAKHYPQVRLLHNEKSKGVSGARNTAMAHMQGKACFFLDGDDILPHNALAPLMDAMRQHNVPLVQGRLHTFCKQRWLWTEKEIPKEQSPLRYPTDSFVQYLYDTTFLKEHGFHFPENCTRGQDRAFFCQVFCKHSEFLVIDNPVYFYRINHKRNGLSAKQALSFIDHITYVSQYLEEAQKIAFFPSYMQSQFCELWLRYAHNTLQESPEALEEYLTKCAAVLANKEALLRPVLEADLQDQAELFWEACAKQDTQGMLTAMQNTGLLRAPEPYIGISEKMLQKHWSLYKILHKIRNICTMPQHIRHLYYTYTLEKKAKAFCLQA